MFPQAYSVPYEQSQANGTSVHDQPEDSGDEYDASLSSSSSQGPPGFSSTVKGSQVRASPRIAFCRLQQNPGMPGGLLSSQSCFHIKEHDQHVV